MCLYTTIEKIKKEIIYASNVHYLKIEILNLEASFLPVHKISLNLGKSSGSYSRMILNWETRRMSNLF